MQAFIFTAFGLHYRHTTVTEAAATTVELVQAEVLAAQGDPTKCGPDPTWLVWNAHYAIGVDVGWAACAQGMQATMELSFVTACSVINDIPAAVDEVRKPLAQVTLVPVLRLFLVDCPGSA